MSYQDDTGRDNRFSPPPLPSERGGSSSVSQSEYQETGGPAYVPPEEQKGGCSKGCIYGMVGCGCFTVILAIVASIAGYKAFQMLQKSGSTDPTVVKATAQQMADFEAPLDLQPALRVDLMLIKFVIYASKDSESQLSLVGINEKSLPAANRQQVRDSMQEQFEKERIKHGEKEIEILKTEVKEVKIRGKNSKVTFAEGKERDGKKEYLIAKGQFEGKEGPVEFNLRAPKDKMTEEQARKFLESLK